MHLIEPVQQQESINQIQKYSIHRLEVEEKKDIQEVVNLQEGEN
jgi:hypothetical protein